MQNTTSELREAMNLAPLRGLTVAQALEVARIEYSNRLRNWQLWAARPTNQRALDAARVRLSNIEYVLRVLESAPAPGSARSAAPQRAVKRPPAPTVARVRCRHYRAIRRAFAIAIERHLDTSASADEEMRAAFSSFLGRRIAHRDELTGGEWLLLGDAIKSRQLAW